MTYCVKDKLNFSIPVEMNYRENFIGNFPSVSQLQIFRLLILTLIFQEKLIGSGTFEKRSLDYRR